MPLTEQRVQHQQQQPQQQPKVAPDLIKIKLKRGLWEVEISCPEEKVEGVVKSVLSGLYASDEFKVPATMARSDAPSLNSGRIETCRGLISELWTERWFETERGLSQVHEELARRGYNYDKTAVSHSLTDLTRENVLTRVGPMRNYRYVQKRPTSAPTMTPQ